MAYIVYSVRQDTLVVPPSVTLRDASMDVVIALRITCVVELSSENV